MAYTLTNEIIIAGDDHRILSASAEAWKLVYNDVFIPMEHFVTEEFRSEFLRHLESGDHEWFIISFIKVPDTLYLSKFSEESSVKDLSGENNIRLLVAPAGDIMEAHRDAAFTLNSYDAMLSLFEDLFFEYRPEDNSIRLFNTDRSRFDEEVIAFDEFALRLKELAGSSDTAPIETFLEHMRQKTPRFAVSVPVNLFNEDRTVTSTMIKGAVAHHGGYEMSVIGLMHPQRMRGTGSGELTYDPLTGLVNKADITQLAIERIDSRRAEDTVICIVDVDYFKHVNDNYGHQFGDQVLKQIAAIMDTEVAEDGVVGRIGGDEFFIVFYHTDEETLRAHLRSIKSMVNATFKGKGPTEDKPISVSVGTASFPQDADNYNDLFMVADYCLYLAKEKGRNRYIIYTPEKHATLEQIKNKQTKGERNLVNGRDDLPLGDALTQMQFMVKYGKKPPIPSLLAEFSDRFNIPVMMLLMTDDAPRLISIAGRQAGEIESPLVCAEELLSERLRLKQFKKFGMIVINNVDRFADDFRDIRDRLIDADIRSFIVIPFTDAGDIEAALVFESLHRNVFWNEQHYMYYRLFADSLSLYDLKNALPDEEKEVPAA